MLSEFYLTLGQVGVIAVLGAIGAVMFRNQFRLSWFVGALALYVVYNFLLTRGFFALPNLPQGSGWNWFGKGLSLSFMLIIAAFPLFGYRRCGITVKQNKRS